MQQATCQHCGSAFELDNRRGRPRLYCDHDCTRAAQVGVPRRRWLERRKNAPSKRSDTGTCIVCAQALTGRQRAFCSDDCCYWHRHNPGTPKPVAARSCTQCGADISHMQRSAKFCSERCKAQGRNTKQPQAFKCKACGELCIQGTNVPRNSYAFCNQSCASKHAGRVRRARHAAAFVEHVTVPQLVERDGWECKLCGDTIDRAKRFPDFYAATIDHIVPLAKGGKHELSNTQLAHYICNTRKRDRTP